MENGYYLSYVEKNAPTKVLAKVASTLSDYTFFDGRLDPIEAMKKARFLITVFNGVEDFASSELRTDWDFFSGEIRWKRKTNGEIILLVPKDIDFARLPSRLKDCTYFAFDEVDDLKIYLNEECTKPPKVAEHNAAASIKQIMYSPRPAAVKQIEFSIRAPKVPSFDGTIKIRGKRTESGCKDDHVYPAGYSGPKPAVKDEFNNSEGIFDLSGKKKAVKSGGVGCFIAMVVLILAGIIIGIIFAGAASAEEALPINVLPTNVATAFSYESGTLAHGIHALPEKITSLLPKF